MSCEGCPRGLDAIRALSGWAEFEDLLEKYRNGGLWHFERELKDHVVRYGWQALFPILDKKVFHRRALFVHADHCRRGYHSMHLEQLQAFSSGFLVYRQGVSCMDLGLHEEFDRLALPSSHPFWSTFLPPNGWMCDCRAAATHSERGVARLGGDLTKPLPAYVDDSSWRETVVEPGFFGQAYPSIEQALLAAVSGRFDAA